MDLKLQKTYDGFAETYDENRGLFDMTEVFEIFYTKLPGEKGRLLDLGCGAGDSFARLFVDRDWEVIGVDFSKRMLELASKHVPKMQTIHADMSQIELDANQFNAITAIYSLFHIPAQKHIALFGKFYRWLVPNGKILFTYATKKFTGSHQFDGYKEFMGQELYYSHKSPEELYSDLEATGFSVDSSDYRDIGNEIFLWVTATKII